MTTTDWIQALSAVAIVILTGALVWVTLKYVNHTKRMANIMAQEFETKIRPLLEIENVHSDHREGGYLIKFYLSNYGVLPIKLDRLQLVWWFSDQDSKVYKKDFPFRKTIGAQQKSVSVNLDLSDSEILDKRKILKNQADWLSTLHDHIQFKIVIFYFDRTGIFIKNFESIHYKVLQSF